MLIDEVATLWRRWNDEPDLSNYSQPELAVIMRLAHEQYRKLIHDQNRWLLAISVDLVFPTPTLGDDRVYGLAGGEPIIIMGNGVPANITNPRLVEAVALRPLFGTEIGTEWTPVSSWDELQATTNSYMFDGRSIRLSTPFVGSMRFSYLPNAVLEYTGNTFLTDWSLLGAGTEEIEDDFRSFHDIIALLAYDYYAITDDLNPKTEEVRDKRVAALKEHIYGRTSWAGDRVALTMPRGSR